jgi:Fumarylacetoacetate (FAA) hydrolase family
MFHPVDHPLERGWVGRLDGEHVVQLAAQTLQSFFTGGGSAREHAVYPIEGVCLVAPVFHPPAVRIFDDQKSFTFANPAAIVGPRAEVAACMLLPRLAAVIGAEGSIAGYTILAEWRDPAKTPPKDRDFALGLGPLVVTPDALDPNTVEVAVRVDGHELLHAQFDGFDWRAARDRAEEGTTLRPGDLVACPAPGSVDELGGESLVEIHATGIGVLHQNVVA